MASKTFIQIVNEAVDEAKVSVDPLTSGNFASPPRTQMYDRFKRWVNVAYRELLMDRKEWQFRNERATVSVWPRLHLSGLTYVPSVGDVLETDSSGVRFTVKAVHSHEDVEQDTTVEHTVSVEFAVPEQRSNLILRENINRISPTAATNVGYVKGWGTYDFRPMVPYLESININSVTLHQTVANATTSGAQAYPVTPVTREQWLPEYDSYPWNGEFPNYIVQTSQGTYDLYPRPDGEYLLSFDFTRTIPTLVNHDDTPFGLPEEYHEYLVWKAVEEYADYDGNPKLFARARKHTEKYRNYLERDQMPEINIKGWGVVKSG